MHERRGIGMDRVFVDEETGEDLIHPFYDYDISRLADSTTTTTTTVNDAETGEPEVTHVDHTTVRVRHRRVPFQVHGRTRGNHTPCIGALFHQPDTKLILHRCRNNRPKKFKADTRKRRRSHEPPSVSVSMIYNLLHKIVIYTRISNLCV